ncbi:Holliday junction ATP-dependent DNA helicase RuvA [Polymorphobacter glacialis]|uniref:Holliday junction branch migration complex subunit RuvA n=1 Tax=Sandarakinorhabdus glacialis TaxID=1614636 RepID=A0A916ZSW7_9SPHN|nr:Holliday junction branch migration protein RuvA [Polymorphobacter glacialis]GGE12481.1 Holliday junction ATP-dependent DNA helicase RuvA [Polymorphobacter glacialis]
MIAKLRGLLDSAGADTCIIDVGGVGYLVSASTKTLGALAPGPVTLHIETQVREDAIQLFGFVSVSERDSFRLLTTVQGVGGRVALAILSVLGPDELAHAIAASDTASIARANGVGPKLAARIANELKGKFGAVALGTSAPLPVGSKRGDIADALTALAGLGFKPMDASRAVAEAQAELGDGAGVSELIRVALRKSAR